MAPDGQPGRRRLKLHLPSAPDGWQVAVGAFAACQGLKFVLEPGLFLVIPSYQYLAMQPLSQGGWAVILFGYAAATVAALCLNRSSWRAAVAIVGGGLWLFVGSQIVAGSVVSHTWYADGPFEVLLGLGSMVAAAQAARRRRP